MTYRIHSAGICGIDGIGIVVEIDMGKGGFPGVKIIGLPHKSVEEARERVRTAMRNSGYGFPQSRITINLTPAYMQKKGTQLDLAIAAGILVAQSKIPPHTISSDTIILGELSLNGAVQPVQGVVPMLQFALQNGYTKAIIPSSQAHEWIASSNIHILPISHIQDLRLPQKNTIQNKKSSTPRGTQTHSTHHLNTLTPTSLHDIQGNALSKRAVQVAAAGRHSILLKGSPGIGKTLLAQALIGLLPPPTQSELSEIYRIASATGYVADCVNDRPFCQPHHSISTLQLIGGGPAGKPGYITKAHKGVLMLDELPEFSKSCLESLRQPMEMKEVSISSACGSLKYPADPLIVATANPCPCGFLGHPTRRCTCSQGAINAYRRKLSKPLLERFDITINVDHDSDQSEAHMYSSENILRAHRRQIERGYCNADIPHTLLLAASQLELSGEIALNRVAPSLSMRAFHKTLRVARTIADLEDSPHVQEKHILEALQFKGSFDIV